MSDDRGQDTRELRLEGIGLFIVGALLLSGLAGAFYLGRWVERRAAPRGLGAEMTGEMAPEGRGQLSDADVGSGHFDTVDGGEKEAEPQRQTVAPASTTPPPTTTQAAVPPTSSPDRSAPASGGSWYVQVSASRDRSSAEKLVGALGDAGFPVRLFTEPQGQSTVYKVRVGGYATRGEADAVKTRLDGRGYEGAWITQIR